MRLNLIGLLVTIALSQVFLTPAWSDGPAGSCPNIRLDQGDGNVAPIPIHAQPDEIGICYAIVASEMADAYRFSSPEADRKQITSFLVTAATFSGVYREKINALTGRKGYDGIDAGTVGGALSALKQKGGCDQNRLFKSPSKVDVARDISDLKSLLKTYQKAYKKAPDTAVPTVFSEMANTEFSNSMDFLQQDMDRVFSHPEFYKYADDFFTEACKGITIPLDELPAPHNVFFQKTATQNEKSDSEKRQGLRDALRASLGAAHPQPIGIDYCLEAVTNDDDSGSALKSGCTELHGSLIVGVRPNKSGDCGEVLIRYTKGPSCDPAVKVPCDKESPGEYWVSIDKLAPKTKELVYLEHP